MTAPADPRHAACEELAARIAAEGGLESARLLQLAGLLGPELKASSADGGAPAAEVAAALTRRYLAGAPAPVGIWKPDGDEQRPRFLRDRDAPNQSWWPPHAVLEPKRSLLPLRVCLLGESAAAGWFYAPELTPAKALAWHLEAARPGLYEVLDLTQVNLQPGALAELFAACLQLTPDVVVIFAGNNWPVRLPTYPGARLADAQSAALAVREAGLQGLRDWCESRTRESAGHTLAVIARLAESQGVPLALVVPEVNLADWGRRRPVSWLAGDACIRWHAAHEQALDALAARRWQDALDHAGTLLELDGGICATGHEIAARALSAIGRLDEARASFRRAVDARAWDNFPSMPSATSVVQQALRDAARTGGFALIDLPALFAADDAPPPGRRLFLDYCHLTPEGMHLAMASVAAEVTGLAESPSRGDPLGRRLATEVTPPPIAPEVEAAACFMTALYNVHYGAELNALTGRQLDRPDGVGRYWLRRACDASPGVRDQMRLYVRTRCAPRRAFALSAAQQEWHATVDALQRQSAYNDTLDPEIVHAIAAMLDEKAASGAIRDVLAHHCAEDGPVDLADPVYHWNVVDRHEDRAGFGYERCAHLRIRWPASHFCLVARGGMDLRLSLTARLPVVERGASRAGRLRLEVNGTPVGDAMLGSRWSRHEVGLPGSIVAHGHNQLTLRWPDLEPEGGNALVLIRRSLESGLPADLHPLFGELASLLAGPASLP